MKRLITLAGTALAALSMAVWLTVSPAAAGGWAVTTLDPMSPPVAGATIEIGFTILQHGRSPVNPDAAVDGIPGEPVAVAVRSADGGETVFTARQDGPTGHYVAEVTFPQAGQFDWEVRQGWFGPQDLGAIDVLRAEGADLVVTPPSPAPSAGSEYRWPVLVRAAVPSVGIAAAAFLLADLLRQRRRVLPATEG